MKCSLCCIAAYYLTAVFSMIQQIDAITDQLPILEHGGDTSSSLVPQKTCEARLDLVERKVEFQNEKMAQLRQDHEELKALYWTLKKTQKAKEDSDEKQIKMDFTTTALSKNMDNSYNNQIKMKRPVRLLPNYLFRVVKNSSTEVFNDPPTNCRDLSEIGYTLNGYYPVQLKLNGEQKSDKIGMIYCKFNSDTKASPAIAERRVGFLDVKSSPIHFHVQRSTPFKDENKVIRPYEIELLNQGGAMNRTSGIFKAPVNGIYFFSFRGQMHTKKMMDFNYIHLRKNGVIVATSISTFGMWHVVSLECTIRLKKYDHIDAKKGPNEGELAENVKEHLTHFSGYLIEEDLTL